MTTDAKVHAVIYIPVRKPSKPDPGRVEPDKVEAGVKAQATSTEEERHAIASRRDG